MAELIRVGIFVTAILALYALFFLHVIYRIVKRLSGRPARRRTFDNKYFAVALRTTALLGIICIIWGTFFEPYIITVTNLQISTDKIKSDVPPIRIVQISDLHFSKENRLTRALPRKIRGLEPDVIVLIGDYLNSNKAAPLLEKFLTNIKAPFGVYYVGGNYERVYPSDNTFAKTGHINLEYNTAKLTIRGAKIELVGAPINFDANRLQKVISADEDSYKVLLSHYPSDFPRIYETDIDLHLCGHTHGGQIRMPFYGALITLSTTGKKYEYGLYEEKGKKLFVSRGIGMMGLRGAPKVRFNCPPEIVLIEIGGAE